MCWIEMTDATKIPPKTTRTAPFTGPRINVGAYVRRINRAIRPKPTFDGAFGNAILAGILMHGKQSMRPDCSYVRWVVNL